ncbi:MAG: T9SS type A sorting domain-containing protein [Bacteroidales bacterium]|nr:T9SS type A sorting domain-containing protein [Bacteroidales bacterium]
MKTKSITTLIFLITFCFSMVSAQEIQPNVVQEGRIWLLYTGPSGDIGYGTGKNFGAFFGTDTVIDGKTYKNVLYRRVFYWDNFDELPTYNWGFALREEGSKVYHYDYATKEERLLFDFSLKPGDTVETYTKLVVTSVGFTEGETPLRYIELHSISPEIRFDRWIERVGSEKSGIAWNYCWNCVGGYNKDFVCCKEKNDENPFFTAFTRYCMNAKYVTVKGQVSFVPLSNADSSTLWAVIDNPYYEEEEEKYTPKYTTLMRNSTPFAQKLVVDGVEYLAGDNVEITGWLSFDFGLSDLEILSIKKIDMAVQPSQKAELKLSPNPASETVTISAAGCSLQRVEILNANGRVLYAAALNNPDSFRYNVAWMPSGIYLVRVKTPCGVLTEKFSVK